MFDQSNLAVAVDCVCLQALLNKELLFLRKAKFIAPPVFSDEGTAKK